MASLVEIYNIALIALGSEPIVSETDLTASARTVNALYATQRDRVLAAHPWNFALARAALATTTAPAFGYATAFALPADPYCLRAWSIYELEEADWKVEGRTLVTNALASTDACRLIFIKRVTDPNEFAPGFTDVLGLSLAERAAMKITDSKTLKEEIRAALKTAWREARSQNAQEAGRAAERLSTFEEARL